MISWFQKRLEENPDGLFLKFGDNSFTISDLEREISAVQNAFLASGINKCRSIIAAYCPSYITSNNMKKILSNEGYIIYGGRGYLEEKGIFLVSVMSTSITVDLVKDFINVFDRILKKAKQ